MADSKETMFVLFSKSNMAATSFSQSGAELGIQDGGTQARKIPPCWKTAHQRGKREGEIDPS